MIPIVVKPPLTGITISLTPAPIGLEAVAEAFIHRAELLGARVERNLQSTANKLVAQFEDGGGARVVVYLRGWPCGNQPISEALAQAACGLSGWHARNAGGVFALGPDYLSVLSASLMCTTGVAALIGQYRGSGSREVNLSLGGVGLLSMAQYLAMDDAGQASPSKAGIDWSSPPFISVEGHLFELEALSPEAWLSFWSRLQVSAVDIAAAWSPFLQRYTTAQALLPSSLFDACSSRRLVDLQRMARNSGVDICPLRSGTVVSWQTHGPWSFGEPRVAACSSTLNTAPERPLTGLRGIEACRLIQGPLAGHLLRELGMELVKVEPPGSDPMRGMAPLVNELSVHFHAINRDKSCVELNLRSGGDRERLLQMAGGADVFLHNWAPGRAERLGLTPDILRRQSSSLIYASASGTGRVPKMNDPLATDFMIQAYSGLACRINQAESPAGALLTLVDVLGGVALAEGVVAALYARYAHQQVLELDSAMAGAAALLMASSPGSPPARSFATADGYVMVESCSRHMLSELDLRSLATTKALTLLAKQGVIATPVSFCAADVGAHPNLSGTLSRDEHGLNVATPWIINA
ncbi:CoA transferase [Halomonas sp. AOP12-C2-37]|uniref:CAIB/BAIF family protein n=1 Tax=Halomonas citrativorans TaxID=2742612 RepID=A0A1R4HXW3_9GAMM|nr:CoA transferase [Halomonas citrativorans]MBE0402395.1 CoA transferase [Halomonas citrativorans]SJN12431.1 CAIB/BAIF family protein [Halomonas citrativorans]